jgi:hypothetical protein
MWLSRVLGCYKLVYSWLVYHGALVLGGLVQAQGPLLLSNREIVLQDPGCQNKVV